MMNPVILELTKCKCGHSTLCHIWAGCMVPAVNRRKEGSSSYCVCAIPGKTRDQDYIQNLEEAGYATKPRSDSDLLDARLKKVLGR